jgi:hypothetical protein
LQAARPLAGGETVTINGWTYQRVWTAADDRRSRRGGQANTVVRDMATGKTSTARRIEDDLPARRTRAQHEAWLGEVDGIDLTLTFLRQKREETKRLARTTPVELGIPIVAAS